MTDDIVFEDPGPARTTWVKRLEPVMERPGEWARVKRMGSPTSARSTVSDLRHGRRAIPDGEWEFVSRTEDDTGWVYAKYLGEECILGQE